MTDSQTQYRTVVTFGSNHNHPVSGRPMGHSYVVVAGADYDDCRARTIERFGNRWAFDYLDGDAWNPPRPDLGTAEDQAGVDRYDLTEVDFETGEVVVRDGT
jgi:hypothetical protein